MRRLLTAALLAFTVPAVAAETPKRGGILTYMIPADAVKWPRGFGLDGWFKGLFSQRRYIP